MAFTILSGIVGSHAYGLAREGSDIDRLAVHVAPTDDLLGLSSPIQTMTRSGAEGEDSTSHEVGKFVKLALACNPTIAELLWLPNEMYEIRTTFGQDLIGLAPSFLCARKIRGSYLGYANAQALRCTRPFGTPGRLEKAARHTYRLAKAGQHVWRTGEVLVALPDPQACFAFGKLVADGNLVALAELLAETEQVFAEPTPLPEDNDEGWQAADTWLRHMRLKFWM